MTSAANPAVIATRITKNTATTTPANGLTATPATVPIATVTTPSAPAPDLTARRTSLRLGTCGDNGPGVVCRGCEGCEGLGEAGMSRVAASRSA